MSNPQQLPESGTPPSTDSELARRASSGDAAAFREIMQRNNMRLYRVARSVLKNDSDAEDALQDAYLTAFSRLREFRGDSALTTWLTRIVLNEALGRLRRRRRSAEVLETIENDIQTAQVVRFPGMASDIDPEKATATGQIARLVERAVDALPFDFRVVFVMRCIEEMSVVETAEQLAIPEATVKTRLHRARLLLRRALDEELKTSLVGAFPFAGARCARMTDRVIKKLGLAESA